jgi:transposase
MRKPSPITKERMDELESFRKEKWTGFEFQRFLCVWLREKSNMPTDKIAAVLGWHVNTVRFTQRDFVKRGVSALIESKKGGRFHSLMTAEAEAEFLSKFEEEARNGEILTASGIKEAIEKHLGRQVHLSTVYRILRRQGWRKTAPRPGHPKRDKEAGGAFKKGASLKS